MTAKKATRKLAIDKSDKQAKAGLDTRPSISKHHAGLLAAYCKEKHISKRDFLHEIIEFFNESQMPINALWVQNDKNLVRKYHDYTAAFLKQFETNYLKQQTEFNEKQLKLIQNMLVLFNNQGKMDAANTDLLRVIVDAVLDPLEAKTMLNLHEQKIKAIIKK